MAHESQKDDNHNVETINMIEDEERSLSTREKIKKSSFKGKFNTTTKVIDNEC